MRNGIQLDCTFDWDAGAVSPRTGRMQVKLQSLDDFREVVSRLISGTLLFDPKGSGYRLRLIDPDNRPPRTFPAQILLRVVEEPFRDEDPLEIMKLGNNFLQAAALVQVRDFQPPTPEGQAGQMTAICDDADSYQELLRFLDEPHGTMLAALDGRGQWFVSRISDTGHLDRPFPQVVTLDLRWLRLE